MPRPYSAWFSRTANLCLDVLEDRMVPASFQGLSSLLGPMGGSLSTNISANGLVVVGSSHNGAYEEAFRWTTAGGMVGLGSIPTGTNSGANAVSEDGTVVVGYSDHNGIAQDAFRWTPTGGMVGLGSLSGLIYFSALATSSDGSVIVGLGGDGMPGGVRAFRWTEATGMTGLGALPGANASRANGVSADGTVIVGTSPIGGIPGDNPHAFRWTAATGMVALSELPGVNATNGTAVSADGSVIVGTAQTGGMVQAFRWSMAGGMVGLGILPGTIGSFAQAVSADGSVVVGGSDSSNNHAFWWTAASGMRNLRNMLISDYGLGSQLAGWTLANAIACSADGMAVTGIGINPSGVQQAWVARLTPKVQQVQINDGSAQRSTVTSLMVTFDSPANLPTNPADAFQLKRQSDNAPVALSAAVSGNAVTLTFTGGPVEFGSLADGRYTLTALASQINNGNFDGNNDGIGGDDYVLVGDSTASPQLFRLFGDSDGDGAVAAADFILFRLAFAGGPPTPFDFDNDGSVSASDFIQFRLRFGGSI